MPWHVSSVQVQVKAATLIDEQPGTGSIASTEATSGNGTYAVQTVTGKGRDLRLDPSMHPCTSLPSPLLHVWTCSLNTTMTLVCADSRRSSHVLWTVVRGDAYTRKLHPKS